MKMLYFSVLWTCCCLTARPELSDWERELGPSQLALPHPGCWLGPDGTNHWSETSLPVCQVSMERERGAECCLLLSLTGPQSTELSDSTSPFPPFWGFEKSLELLGFGDSKVVPGRCPGQPVEQWEHSCLGCGWHFRGLLSHSREQPVEPEPPQVSLHGVSQARAMPLSHFTGTAS